MSVVVVLSAVGPGIAIAQERPIAQAGNEETCLQLYLDSDEELRLYENATAGMELSETELLEPVQAITSELGFRLVAAGCPALSVLTDGDGTPIVRSVGGSEEACLQLYLDSDAEFDAIENATAGQELTETELIEQVQAVTSELNFRVVAARCPKQ